REKVTMDELVVAREEDAEIRVRVIPADDVEVGVEAIALSSDLLPGIMSISKTCLGVLVVLGLQRPRDQYEREPGAFVETFLAEQDPAQLHRGVAQGVPLDRVRRLAIEIDRQIDRIGRLVCQTGPAAVAIGPAATLGFAILYVVEDDVVVAQAVRL